MWQYLCLHYLTGDIASSERMDNKCLYDVSMKSLSTKHAVHIHVDVLQVESMEQKPKFRERER